MTILVHVHFSIHYRTFMYWIFIDCFFLRFIPEEGFDCLMDQLRFVCHSYSLKKNVAIVGENIISFICVFFRTNKCALFQHSSRFPYSHSNLSMNIGRTRRSGDTYCAVLNMCYFKRNNIFLFQRTAMFGSFIQSKQSRNLLLSFSVFLFFVFSILDWRMQVIISFNILKTKLWLSNNVKLLQSISILIAFFLIPDRVQRI